MKSHRIARARTEARCLLGIEQRGYVVSDVTTVIGEEANDHDRVGAQPEQRVRDEGGFFQAGGFDAGEQFRGRHAGGMSMQCQRPAGGGG